MKNLLTTIPQRDDLRHWSDVEPMLRECIDEENYWTFSCAHYPKQSGPGALCFIVHSGFVRGYFTVLEFFDEAVYRTTGKGEEVEYKAGKKVKLATWRPLAESIAQPGFQGYRYTQLQAS
jgi:hypothetical protein